MYDMKPKVSVIVPIYKAEAYLADCLASLQAQTYPNLEIILVDDGSPDGCGRMCDAFGAQNENVVVVHQENCGVAAARNHGVSAASGEYIAFVDADDRFTVDYISYLVEILLAEQGDIAVSSFRLCSPKGEMEQTYPQKELKVLSTAEALEIMCYGHKFSVQPWGKLYSKAALLANPYPLGCVYEDLDTTYKIIGASERVVYGDKIIYHWVQHEGSITHSAVTQKQLYGVTAAKHQLDYVQQNYPSAVPAAQFRCATKIVDFATRSILTGGDKQIFNGLKQEMKAFIKPVCKNKKVSTLFKLRCLAVSWGYVPAYLLSHIYAKLKKIP